MRWKYPDESEAAARRKVMTTIGRWWREFDKKTADFDAFFRGKKKWDLPGWVNKHLNAIAEGICWEFGPGEGGHRLALTPESRHHLRPLVEVILREAPEIPGWTFVPARPAESVEMALHSVQAKGGKDLAKALASASPGESHCIDLAFSCDVYTAPDERQDLGHALWLTEGLLGEEVLNRWVGVIATVSDRRTGRTGHPMERLRETAEKAIAKVVKGLPERPAMEWREDAEWTGYECRPRTGQDDYAGQSDLIAAAAILPEMWMAARSRRVFWSGRFSRCGETFAYLKIEGSRRPAGAEADYRHQIDEAVNAALVSAGVGASVGGGSGIRYCYVDLALTDVPAAIHVIRRTLADFDIPERSWLLFHDDDLAAEWAGLTDATPEPPWLPE